MLRVIILPVLILAAGLLNAALPAPGAPAFADSPARSNSAESYIAGFFRATVETAVTPQSDESAIRAVKALLTRAIPLDDTARFMLGRAWPSDNQRAGRQFQKDFQEFVAETVTWGLRANPSLALTVKGSRTRSDGTALVLSMLALPSGMTLPVDWLVARDPVTGTFQVTDITVAGLNAASMLRSMTEATLARTDIGGVIPEWRANLERHTQSGVLTSPAVTSPAVTSP